MVGQICGGFCLTKDVALDIGEQILEVVFRVVGGDAEALLDEQVLPGSNMQRWIQRVWQPRFLLFL